MSIDPADSTCEVCGRGQVRASGDTPYCPCCKRAYHALEVRYNETGEEATVEEIVAAMIEDGDLSAAGVGQDGTLAVRVAQESAEQTYVDDPNGYGMVMPDYFYTGDGYISMRALGIASPRDVTPRPVDASSEQDAANDGL